MTEHRLRWSAQARLMRHDIVETPVSRAGVSSLVGGCREGGKSFISVSGVRRESVGHASRTVCVFCRADCIVVRICGCICVVLIIIIVIVVIKIIIVNIIFVLVCYGLSGGYTS